MSRWTALEDGNPRGGDCMFQLRRREKTHEPAFYVDTATHLQFTAWHDGTGHRRHGMYGHLIAPRKLQGEGDERWFARRLA